MNLRTSLLFSLLLLTLTACGSQSANSPEALPTVVLESGNAAVPAVAPSLDGVAASGVVMPAQEASMAFAQGGIVETVNVKVGDRVQAGDLLVELDNTTIKLDLAQAERNLREMTSPAAIAPYSRHGAKVPGSEPARRLSANLILDQPVGNKGSLRFSVEAQKAN